MRALKPKRRIRNRPEQDQQIAFFKWVRMHEKTHPELAHIFHCPNGGKRNAREAGILKAMGVRAGVPDVLWPIPYDALNLTGLAIEFKASGRTSAIRKDQACWAQWLETQGYVYHVFDSWVDAALAVCDYAGYDDIRPKGAV